MMSENPANRERTRHVDTRVHYLRELVRDGHVKLLKCALRRSAECGRYADQKPSASSPFQAPAIHVGHTYSFFSFLRLDGPRRRPTISSHHADTKSHAPPEKYILVVCTCVYVCVVCRYDP
jgi:hypothetical protein